MTDIVIEIIRALIVTVTFFVLYSYGRDKAIQRQPGWYYIIFGFGLVLFGIHIDITDNFPTLNKYIIIGDTQYQAFLEKVIGSLAGFFLIAIGFSKWLSVVTTLKKTEKALLESESLYKYLHANLSDAVFIIDLKGHVLDVNEMTLKRLDYSRDELLRMTLKKINAPEYAQGIKRRILQVYEKGPQLFETVHIAKDGTHIPTEISANLIQFRGKPAILALARDISERKEAENTLLKEKDFLEKLTCSLGEVIFSVKMPERVVAFVNPAVETVFGYTRKECLGMETSMFYPSQESYIDFGRKLKKAIEQEEEVLVSEQQLRRKNGELFPGEITTTFLRQNGEMSSAINIIRDISERKEVEKKIINAKEEWVKTFDAMSDIITIQNKNMEIVRANKAAHDYFQKPLGGLIGYKCFELFSDYSQPCPGCPELKTLETVQCHSEIMQYEKLGKVFHVSSAPILDENNELKFLVHIAKDITEQKRLEEDLFQAHKMEAIGTLAGGIAHDFNNILSAIIGFSEFVKHDLPEDSSAKHDIDEVLKSSGRAADLVQQILTFSRKSEHHLQSLNPYSIVQEALRMLSASLPSSIMIDEDIDKECGQILAEPINIHQIMINLCINALHAMESQKGTLTVRLYRRKIAAEEMPPESSVSAGPFVVLSVSDTGQGMDEATRMRIFEPYFTTKKTGKGSGMGLAVIHGIIQDYKGFVKVDSTPGEGSTFSVFIPALQEGATSHEDSASKEREDEPSLSTENKRILIIDDEPLLVHINKRRLEELGFIVTATTDSKDALEKFRVNPDHFDLLITDQTMPGLTGGELAKKILEIKPSMPIIMCTGHSDIVSKDEALAMGIKEYVFKPIRGDELVNAARAVLNGK